MKELKYKLFLKIWFIVGIMCMMVCACNSGDDKLSDEGKDIENEHGQQKVMERFLNLLLLLQQKLTNCN